MDIGLIAGLVRSSIDIERDANDKPRIAALFAAGTPRDQIVLAYAGASTDAAAWHA